MLLEGPVGGTVALHVRSRNFAPARNRSSVHRRKEVRPFGELFFFFFLFDAWRLRLRRLCSVRHLRPLYFAQRNAQHSAGNDSQLIPRCRRGHSTRERYKWEKHDLKRTKVRETGVVRWRSNTCKRAGALRTSATAENVAGVWPIRTRGLKSKSVARISENVCNVGSTGSELINFMRFVSVFVWTREVASAKQKMLNPTPWAKYLFTLSNAHRYAK